MIILTQGKKNKLYKKFHEQILWQKWGGGDWVKEVHKVRGARKNEIDK